MFKRISAIVVAAFFAVTLPANSALAQNEYERQVRNYLEDAGDDIRSRGYRGTGDVYSGSLDDDEQENVWITLSGSGDYAIIGVCDNDCSDIDLYLFDEDGDQIDSDLSTDDVPVVEVTTRRTGEYRVRVRMYSCSSEPCYYGFAVYRSGRGGGGNVSRGSSSPQGQVRRAIRDAYLDNLADRGFDVTEEDFDGSLDDDEEESVWVTLYRGQSYAILGACDNDCGDMDLFLYDEDGDEVDSDVSTDAIPIVNVRPRATGDYRIKVRMYSCDVEPCYYAVEVFSR